MGSIDEKDDSAVINVDDTSSHHAERLKERVEASVNHRRLSPRQIQLTAIAGSIGAMLFVAIGTGLVYGPLALLMGFLFWVTVVYAVAQCQNEIVSQYPYDASHIQMAGRMVDPAFGVTAGWNYFFQMTSFVIFEATMLNTLVEYWGYNLSPAILITISLLLYLGLNVYRADLFGEAEFWLALGKILLAIGLFAFTFIAMLGGNPLHDRFGFRYWKNPGPWAGDTPTLRFEGWLNAVNVAGFVMGGPEYTSMIAGEAKDPRRVVPRAFKTIIARLIFFFFGSCIAIGILVPYNDPALTTSTGTYAGSSPYVIAMTRLKVPVLPSIVNAALITTIISAGNAYTFNASRALYGMALDKKLPKFLTKINKRGTPYLCVICVMLLSCLAYLALGSGSATVLSWLVNFTTASTMFNWFIMAVTYNRFQAAMKAQGLKREEFLAVRSWSQPYAGYWALFWSTLFVGVQGYAVFLPGGWAVSTFIFNYGIILLAGLIGIVWKLVKRTRFQRAKEIDLHSDLEFFEALTEHYRQEREEVPVTIKDKILAKLF